MQSARTAARGWGGATALPTRVRGAEGNERGRTRQSRTRSQTTRCHARTSSGRPGLLQPQSLLRPGRPPLRLNGKPHCPLRHTPLPKSPGHAGWGELAVLMPQFTRACHSHRVVASIDHHHAGFGHPPQVQQEPLLLCGFTTRSVELSLVDWLLQCLPYRVTRPAIRTSNQPIRTGSTGTGLHARAFGATIRRVLVVCRAPGRMRWA
jgi:hypothetical protein